MGCISGTIDIHTATMTMSRFHVAPRNGHLKRLKQIYGYLRKFSTAAIRVRVEEQDFAAVPEKDFDSFQKICQRHLEPQ
jgi:hypothetical protein